RGQAPCEPEGEHVRIHRLGNRADVLDLLAAKQPILLLFQPYVFQQLGARVAAGRPDLRIGYRADRLPARCVRDMALPSLPEMSVEELAELPAQERREMRPVRHVSDRNV